MELNKNKYAYLYLVSQLCKSLGSNCMNSVLQASNNYNQIIF